MHESALRKIFLVAVVVDAAYVIVATVVVVICDSLSFSSPINKTKLIHNFFFFVRMFVSERYCRE